MADTTVTGAGAGTARWAARIGGWLRGGRSGMFALAVLVGIGSGLGAVVFRYLIYAFTLPANPYLPGQDHPGADRRRLGPQRPGSHRCCVSFAAAVETGRRPLRDWSCEGRVACR